MTRETLHAVSILSLEDVDYKRVVAHTVQLPLLLAGNLGRETLELRLALRRRLELGLQDDTVQVFVEPVEEEAQELL